MPESAELGKHGEACDDPRRAEQRDERDDQDNDALGVSGVLVRRSRERLSRGEVLKVG